MGSRRVGRADRAGRPAMRSPGRPPVGRREHRQRFWAAIARGRRARTRRRRGGRVAGGRRPVVSGGWRDAADHVWPRCRGGTCRSPSGRRSRSCAPAAAGCARSRAGSGRSPSTISRELRRNAATRGGRLEYRATTAQWHADRRARAPEAGQARRQRAAARAMCRTGWPARSQRPDGVAVAGPEVAWIGRRHGRRKDRRWARSWSPEQISNRLRLDFPDDESMRDLARGDLPVAVSCRAAARCSAS